MKTVNVSASKKYEVLIGKGILADAGKFVCKVKKNCKAAIISDDRVFSIYGETVKKSLELSGFSTCSFAFENGEKSKNLKTYAEILDFLTENKISRTDIIVALGGGVVGDVAGFCAATYLRGIDFVQMPTTLLAAVDSSVGGKTAVDLPGGKNLVGAFHQPSLVVCDTDAFTTLDNRQLSCGMAEVIKYAVMCDNELFCLLEKSGTIDYAELVERCVSIKRDIVENDEFDNGERKLLNLGHTLGHAIEKHSDFNLTHGEAVAVGLVKICNLSEKYGYSKENLTQRICAVLEKYGLPTEYEITSKELYSIATGDKKVESGTITLVIPENIGKCRLEKMTLSEFAKMLGAN